MRTRPTTVVGLLARVLVIQRRRAFGVALVAALVVLGWCAVRRRGAESGTSIGVANAPPACTIEGFWRAGVERYDYIQALGLQGTGEGLYVYGGTQTVRTILEFRHTRIDAANVTLADFVAVDPSTGEKTRMGWSPFRAHVRLDAGDFRFVEGAPFAPVERRYRCRFSWDATFSGDGSQYYGVLISERPVPSPARR